MSITHVYKLAATPSQSLFAFSHDYSLDTWVLNRVSGVENSSPDAGQYTFSLSAESGVFWEIFQGSGQPNNWGESVGNISLSLPTAPSSGTKGVSTHDYMIQTGKSYNWATPNGTVLTIIE